MESRRLGRTEHDSAVAILGGAAFWGSTPAEAEAGFAMALERGCNHLDIAPEYGAAETVVGPLIPAVRDNLFVACKTTRRNPDGVRAQLAESMTKLGVDQLDLYQAHGVISSADLDERAEAIETMLRAKAEGLTRFVGITGHDFGTPQAQLTALQRWDLDTIMFPIYPRLWADTQYRADAEALLAEAGRRDCGVMVIKAVARKPWGDRTPDHGTWYEPWSTPWAVERGVRFALSTPGVHAFCTPSDVDVLALALDAADGYEPLDDDARADAVAAMADNDVIFPIAEHAPIR
ncbi:MAG: aldo/keto reductase [Acidimicrobiia bacterium]|nr:aldo/keto reductase [Acidimicrobiia bacterium]